MWLAGVPTGSSVAAAAAAIRKVTLVDRKNESFISEFESGRTGSVDRNELKCACAMAKQGGKRRCFIERYEKPHPQSAEYSKAIAKVQHEVVYVHMVTRLFIRDGTSCRNELVSTTGVAYKYAGILPMNFTPL